MLKLPPSLDSSVGEESTCNAGDPGLIPGWGRSAGEGIGYPLQCSWASLVAQLVKNPPVMRETWVRSLDWEDPLKKGKATHSRILAWRIPWAVYSPWGHKQWDRTERLSLSLLESVSTPSIKSDPAKLLPQELHSPSQHQAATALNCVCEHLALPPFILCIP